MATDSVVRSTKITIALSAEAKYKLSQMKNDLRFQGTPATEQAIVEKLIVSADVKKVAKLLASSLPRSGHNRRRRTLK